MVVDGFGFAAGHRPGHLYERGAQRLRDAAAQAYDERLRRLQDAWRKGKRDDDNPRVVADAGQARLIADRAWRDRRERLQNAWRNR